MTHTDRHRWARCSAGVARLSVLPLSVVDNSDISPNRLTVR